jgi:Regulator of chromosome condensation (RCC1) repeat
LFNLEVNGLGSSKILLDTLKRDKRDMRTTSCFGNESVIGVKHPWNGVKVLERDGNDEKVSEIEGYILVAVAGNGYVAAVASDDPDVDSDHGKCSPLEYIAEYREGSKLEIYSSLKEFLSPPEKRQPLLQLEVNKHYGYMEVEFDDDDDDDPDNRLTKDGWISSLSAGDAHFSFILNYRWHEKWATPVPIQYYSNICAIRTDTRSLNDDAWIPLDEELASMEDPPDVSVDGPEKSTLPIFCAAQEGAVEFEECVSAGWITAGLTKDDEAWIFPFGRSFSKVPNCPIGRVEEVSDVVEIALGDNHIVLRTRRDGVWTFGANDYGQRGSASGDSWKELEIPNGSRAFQVACGRWNTFIVLKIEPD